VSAKKERLSAAEYTKMLTACNDDGAIILKLNTTPLFYSEAKVN
jgi:hypothetical protein